MSTDAAPSVGVPADTLQMRLYIARKHAGGLSADAAGRLVGVSGTTWRNWEAGKPMEHRDLKLPEIARRLHLPAGYFDGIVPAVAPVSPNPEGTPGEGSPPNPRYGRVLAFRRVMRRQSSAPRTPVVPHLSPAPVAA